MVVAVLDTNVLVSALLSPFGAPGRVLDLVLLNEIRPAFDGRILAEYRQVLGRPKFAFAGDAVADLLALMEHDGLRVLAPPLAAALPDPDDAPFLEVAAAAGAILVTGNARHFPPEQRRGVRVWSPAEAVAALARR